MHTCTTPILFRHIVKDTVYIREYAVKPLFSLFSFKVDKPITQKLCKPLTEEGYETTLQNLLDLAIPNIAKGRCVFFFKLTNLI